MASVDDVIRLFEEHGDSEYGGEQVTQLEHALQAAELGERQAASESLIAAALLHDPEVIIVDEPMVGLDPVAIMMVKDLFRNLAKQGVTIFMSTHTLKIAEDICDRIGVIHKGHLIATGTTEDLQREAQVVNADLEQVFLNLTTG